MAESHQPDWPCELWPDDSSDYLGVVPALPDADEEPFQDILLSALTTRTMMRARRIDRYMVEQLKIGIRGVEIDYLHDLVMFRVNGSKTDVSNKIEGTAYTRENLPGKVVFIMNEGVLCACDGRFSREAKESYVSYVAGKMKDDRD